MPAMRLHSGYFRCRQRVGGGQDAPALTGHPLERVASLGLGGVARCTTLRWLATLDTRRLDAKQPAAWNLFSAKSRHVFRAELDVDADGRARGRGWALSLALIVLPFYLTTNPGIVAVSRRAIDAVISDR